MARILIAGCGYVGAALGALLAADGHRVFGLRRNPSGLPPGIEPLAADLTAPATLTGLPGGLDAVVYAASAGGGGEAAYRDAYVSGLANLLAALADAGQRPARLLYTSSTGVYGQADGEWVDEDSSTEGAPPSGRILLEGEALALAAPLPAGVVRFGGIYGPGRTRLLRRAREGARFRPHQYTNRIHRDDCAGVLRHLLAREELPRVLLGVDCEPASEETVLGWLARRLDGPPPQPDPAADPPPRGNKRCRNDRLLATGYRFLFPSFREGYGALIESEGA